MPAEKPVERMKVTSLRTRTYHLMIFAGAVIILVLGAVWRGGDQPAESSEVTAIEALKEEVSGVQSALSRNELEVIRDAMTAIPKEVALSVVALKPREEEEPIREILVYGTPSGLDVFSGPARPRAISGLVLDREGYILTSANIAQYEFPVQVVFRTVVKAADWIAGDTARHVALLKLRELPAGLVPLGLAKAAELKSGEWLVREGRTPSGEETRSLHFLESLRTLTSGETVGLFANEGTPYMDGAALVNSAGNIVGLYVHPAASDAFVLPIRRAVEIAARLKTTAGTDIRGWSGIELQALDTALEEYFGATTGVLVSSVQPGSPAAKAGLRPMDIVERANETDIVSPAELLNIIGQSEPGTRIPLTIRRNSRQQKVEVIVSEFPARDARLELDDESLVVRLERPGDGSGGVKIGAIYPQAAGNRLGLKTGDVIFLINGRPIGNADEFWVLQRNVSNRKAQLWAIRRNDKQFFVAVKEHVIRP